MSVLHDCQVKGWLKGAPAIQPKIEEVHAVLIRAIPDDSTSEADISNQFE
jgi:hypothetical protein